MWIVMWAYVYIIILGEKHHSEIVGSPMHHFITVVEYLHIEISYKSRNSIILVSIK